jgi:colicin import membrane protein
MKKVQRVHSEKTFYFWLTIAAILHLVVFSVSLFLQILDARRQVEPKIVSITLVSLPTEESVSAIEVKPSATKAGLPPAAPVSLPLPAEKRVKAVSSTPLPAKLKAVTRALPEKKPVPTSAKKQDLARALERLKEVVGNKAQPPQPPGSTVKTALAELEKRVNSEKALAVSGGSGERAGVSSGNSVAGKEYGGSGASLAYKKRIAAIIQDNWDLANPLLKNSFGMSVAVRITILSDGSIGQILFVKKSLSEYLNNSVKKALEKSSPLPPLPRGEGAQGVWVAFVFTPEGIEQ